MAGKREGIPISFRIEPELAERLRTFVETSPAWNQTEVMVVALHTLLAADNVAKEEALLAYRRWRADPKPAKPRPSK